MSFLEAGGVFFDGLNLFLAELFALLKMLLFKLEKPLITAPHSMAFHDFPDGGASSSFYLPVSRVVRYVRILSAGVGRRVPEFVSPLRAL